MVTESSPRGAPQGAGRGRGWVYAALTVSACALVLGGIAWGVRSAVGPAAAESAPVTGWWPYVAVFVLVLGDAVLPVLPGETTLNVASTLVASGRLELRWVMLAGALGAVVGDSALYSLARLMRGRAQRKLDAALEDPRVSRVVGVIGDSAPALLVFGRYVPGLRFVVNASLGLKGHPYRNFLRWSAVGGVLWSVYCCSVAYLVGTALVDHPVASLAVSAIASSVAVVVVLTILARRLRRR